MTIATHAFYLAVNGGRNRVSNITVPGAGMANLERIERIFIGPVMMMDQRPLQTHAVPRAGSRRSLQCGQQRTIAGRTGLDGCRGELRRVAPVRGLSSAAGGRLRALS
jgi:hypothetical protein